jgi:7 transmembrane receptor (rhodopsin family)
MLFVVVLEFFICWTPLYVINTIALFDPKLVYQHLGYTAISFLQLLAYSSSCCNPITYCFMSHGFRKAFVNLFRCLRQNHQTKRRVSVSGYVPPTANATTHLHPFNNENDNGNSSVGMFNHSNSENFDLSRQHSYRTKGKLCNESDGSDFREKK